MDPLGSQIQLVHWLAFKVDVTRTLIGVAIYSAGVTLILGNENQGSDILIESLRCKKIAMLFALEIWHKLKDTMDHVTFHFVRLMLRLAHS